MDSSAVRGSALLLVVVVEGFEEGSESGLELRTCDSNSEELVIDFGESLGFGDPREAILADDDLAIIEHALDSGRNTPVWRSAVLVHLVAVCGSVALHQEKIWTCLPGYHSYRDLVAGSSRGNLVDKFLPQLLCQPLH
ncbi:hypothetical protein B0H11DRAFT_1905905 [Mycena galericulata]|nr:hypothetical protein B0H11DRAFT_1905905 [Mycena galericulata]